MQSVMICSPRSLKYEASSRIVHLTSFSWIGPSSLFWNGFEILGEALFRIRNLNLYAFEQIPSGHRIIGMRNILAHGYDRVDYEAMWDAAIHELEALRQHIESLDPELPPCPPKGT